MKDREHIEAMALQGLLANPERSMWNVKDLAELAVHAADALIMRADGTEILRQRDRLLVLATKHCSRDHHDWDEICRLARAAGK